MAILTEFNNCFIQISLLMCCLFVTWKILKYLTSTEIEIGNGNSRRLDFLEDLNDKLSHSLNGVGNMACIVSLKSKENLSVQHIRDALVLLVKRQPMLRAAICTKADGKKYFDIKSIEQTIVLFDISKCDAKISEWQELIYKHTSNVHKCTLPWKAVILQEEFDATLQEYSNIILFSVKHACLDGVSTVKFVQQFTSCINQISSGVTNTDKEVTSFPLLPSGHDIVTQKKTGHSIFRFIVTNFGLRPVLDFLLGKMISFVLKKKAINPYYTRYPHLQSAEISSESQQRLNLKTFSKAETKSIVEACRANGCTVTGAITAAVHLAFYELISGKDKENPQLETFYPLNNRSYGDPKAPEDYLGFFVYFISHYMKYSRCSPEDFWTMAKESTIQLKQCVNKKAFLKEMSLMSVLDPNLLVSSYFEETAFLKSITNVISSYGVFNTYSSQASQMTYSLENCYVLPIVRGNNTLFTHFVYTMNDKLTWMIISDVHIPSSHAEQFSNNSFNTLLANCAVTEKRL